MNQLLAAADTINTKLTLSSEVCARFASDGFVHLEGVLSSAEVNGWRQVITDSARARNTETRPLEERDTYDRAFLQTMNLWESDPEVRRFVFSRRLAAIARDLLQVEGVRLYHDQALFKESGGGHTPWHADQHYWPLGSDRVVTAWVPLVDVPLEMGPLAFARRSQSLADGRGLKIGDESEAQIGRLLADSRIEVVEEPFAAGDVSFHLGWTFHRAGANRTGHERSVMTMIYMDRDMLLREPENVEQERDRARWCPGVEVGSVCDSELNPLLAGSSREK
jgi:ectoine hydroxylase-related dioxygenase (phytanoyl-CoA dioxygenase family)